MLEQADGPAVGIGIIGVGQRGRHHIAFLREAGGGRVVALADPHEPSLRQAWEVLPGAGEDVRDYDSWEGLLADEAVEAVIVGAPNHLHAEAAIAALRAGKHVLLEKPVALTVEDCRRLEEAAAAAPGVLQVGLELRYSPVAQRLRREIELGAIGEPRMAWCHEFRVPFRPKVDDWILDRRRSGGTFVEKNCHHLDLLSWLLDSEPVRVAGFGGSDVVYRDRPEMLDNAWVVVEHAGGRRASLGVAMFSRVDRLELGVLGDAGLLEADFHGRQVVLRQPDGSVATIAVGDPAGRRIAVHGGADLLQMEDFLRTVRAGGQPRVTLRDGIRCLLVALAAQRAVDTGRTVAIEEIVGGRPPDARPS